MSAPNDGLDRVPCTRCRRQFVPMYVWQRWCRVCLLERDGQLDLALAETAFERGYLLGLQRGVEHTLAELPTRDLLALCHPDRHPSERAELASRITVWLLAIRDTVEVP